MEECACGFRAPWGRMWSHLMNSKDPERHYINRRRDKMGNINEQVEKPCQQSVHHNANFALLLKVLRDKLKNSCGKDNRILFVDVMEILQDVFNVKITTNEFSFTVTSRYSLQSFQLFSSDDIGK